MTISLTDPFSTPFRPAAQAVGSKLARVDLDLGRRGWMRGGSERMNGKAKDLDQRNAFFICDRDEPGLGLAENLRLFSFNGRKMFEGATPRHHLSFDIPSRPSDTRAMIELEQACQRIFAALVPLPPEPIPLDAAVGRVASEPIVSPIDLPSFDNSAVGGHALSPTHFTTPPPQTPVKPDIPRP